MTTTEGVGVINVVHFGDCRDSMRELIAGGVKVQCCVTSPPYWGLRDYGVEGQLGLEPTLQEYIANMVEVFGLVRQLLPDDGVLWLNMGDSYAANRGYQVSDSMNKAHDFKRAGAPPIPDGLKPKDLIGQPWRLAFALQDDGWYLRQDIIWHKPNPMPESVTDRCTKAHEYIFLLSKSARYYFNQDAIKERANPENYRKSSTKRRESPPGQSCDQGFLNGREYERRNKRSVWTVATKCYSEAHFATFPPALIEPCVLAGSRPGDIVLDPFFGSGTTGEVAQNLGRRWVGCELNPEYEQLQRDRTAQAGLVL